MFKQNFPGFEGWIISSSFDAMKFVGLRPSRKIHLFNGPIETRFVKFEMYAGSKKGKYMTDEDDESPRYSREKKDGDREWTRDKQDRPFSDKRDWKEKRGEDDSEKRDWKKEDRGEGRTEKPWKKRDSSDREWEKPEKRSFDRKEGKKDFDRKSGDKPANEQWYGRKPRLGKPERTKFTGDGKSGTRKRRPRKDS